MNKHDVNGDVMRDEQIRLLEAHTADELIKRWVVWSRTYSIFVPAAKPDRLAHWRATEHRYIQESNSVLDASMPFLTIAIYKLCDREELTDEAECFFAVYCYRVNIKALAYSQQCTRGTVYNRARRFAVRARALALLISRRHALSRIAKCSIELNKFGVGSLEQIDLKSVSLV